MDPGQRPNDASNAWGSLGAAQDNSQPNGRVAQTRRYFPGEVFLEGCRVPFFASEQPRWGLPQQHGNAPPYDCSQAFAPPGRFPEAHQPAFTFPPGAERGGWKHSDSDPFLHSPSAISSPANYNLVGAGVRERPTNDWTNVQAQGGQMGEWGPGGEWRHGDAWVQQGGFGWPAEGAMPPMWNVVSDRPEREQGKRCTRGCSL